MEEVSSGMGTRTARQLLGKEAEDLAAEFLRARGLEVLLRNFRSRLGEIDVVARDRKNLILVEVRARSSEHYAGAAGSVNRRKQQRLIRAAQLLLLQHRELAHLPARFDVITVVGLGGGRPQVCWILHAFST